MAAEARSILIFEPHVGSLKRTISLVEQSGYEAIEAASTDQATAALEDESICGLLVAHTAAGVELDYDLTWGGGLRGSSGVGDKPVDDFARVDGVGSVDPMPHVEDSGEEAHGTFGCETEDVVVM